jgi:hypothetical protein
VTRSVPKQKRFGRDNNETSTEHTTPESRKEQEIDRDYEGIVGRRPLEYLEMLAENITGNVQHINATTPEGVLQRF